MSDAPKRVMETAEWITAIVTQLPPDEALSALTVASVNVARSIEYEDPKAPTPLESFIKGLRDLNKKMKREAL